MVGQISSETINTLRKKSALPDRPTAQGYKPPQIRKALTGFVLDPDTSIITEINRIVAEINAELQSFANSDEIVDIEDFRRLSAFVSSLSDSLTELTDLMDNMSGSVASSLNEMNAKLEDCGVVNSFETDGQGNFTCDSGKSLGARLGYLMYCSLTHCLDWLHTLVYKIHIGLENPVEYGALFIDCGEVPDLPVPDGSKLIVGENRSYNDEDECNTDSDLVIVGNRVNEIPKLGHSGKYIAIANKCRVQPYSVRITAGKNNKITGLFAVSIGVDVDNEELGSVAIGYNTKVKSENGIAIGSNASCSRNGGVSILSRSSTGAGGVSALVNIGYMGAGNEDLEEILSVAGVIVLKRDLISGNYYIPAELIPSLHVEIDVVDYYTAETNKALSANKGKELFESIQAIQALLESDDITLDTVQEIVNYIKSNKTLIEQVTVSKVSKTDIIDNLTSNLSNKPLSAAQGVVLKELIDALPSWSKAEQKPQYTPGEVGAEPAFEKGTAFNKNFGDGEDEVCRGNDERLFDARPANDVPEFIKGITMDDINRWNNPSYRDLTDKPIINGTTLDGTMVINGAGEGGGDTESGFKSVFMLIPEQEIYSLVFNGAITAAKMNDFLSQLTPSVEIGSGDPEIAVILETDQYQGLYSIDLSKLGGSGYAMVIADCYHGQSFDYDDREEAHGEEKHEENGDGEDMNSFGEIISMSEEGEEEPEPYFTVRQIVYLGEYSDNNVGILQCFMPEFECEGEGWLDTEEFELNENSVLYNITPCDDMLMSKVSSFVNENTALWDILSMII